MSNAERYDEDQEKLRRTSEGEPDDEDVRVAIPTAPEVNPDVYRDVLPMIFRGFLTLSAEIHGVSFVFKSLNQHEFELVRLMGGAASIRSSRFWDLFLAYGVFAIDGQNVLVDRQRWMSQIASTFRDMQPLAKNKVIRHLSELNRRAANATTLTEAYTTESYSRYRWAQVQGLDLSTPAVTGVPGTDLLGLNWAQLAWRALNYFEDTSAQQEREWENAKFIGSCSAGKGIQKVYNRDHDRHRKDAEQRIARKDRVLRHVMEGLPIDDTKTVRNGQVVEVAQTVEQLADQLDKSLRGEKDWHDQVVEQHEQRVKQQLQSRQEQFQELVRLSNEKFDGKRLVGSSELRGLSTAEVQERILRAKQLEAQAVAQGFVQPDAGQEERMSNFLDRHGLLGPGVETSIETSDRDPSGATPLPPSRDRGKPWRP